MYKPETLNGFHTFFLVFCPIATLVHASHQVLVLFRAPPLTIQQRFHGCTSKTEPQKKKSKEKEKPGSSKAGIHEQKDKQTPNCQVH